MKNINEAKRDKLMHRWNFHNDRLNKMHGRNITKGEKYKVAFFKAQVHDTALRFIDSGSYVDENWEKMNAKLSPKLRQKAESHQKNLIDHAKLVINSL